MGPWGSLLELWGSLLGPLGLIFEALGVIGEALGLIWMPKIEKVNDRHPFCGDTKFDCPPNNSEGSQVSVLLLEHSTVGRKGQGPPPPP